MKCSVCGKEFESKRSTAKFCSGACKLALHRGKISVTKKEVSVTNDTLKKVSVTDPLKRITRPPDKVYDGYYQSEYKNLIEELIVKPISQLRDEGYYIPSWKDNGVKCPLKVIEQVVA